MCETCDAAWEDFDRWLSDHRDDVQDLSLLEQIDLYAATISPADERISPMTGLPSLSANK